jgi:hypothetical protein
MARALGDSPAVAGPTLNLNFWIARPIFGLPGLADLEASVIVEGVFIRVDST